MIPDRLRDYMANTALLAPPHHYMEPIRFDVARAAPRAAQPAQGALHLPRCAGRESERTVRPLCLAYFGPVWLLSAWCELRDDFRTFRLDRIDDFAVPGDRFRHEPGKTLHDFLKRDQTWTRSRATPNGKCDREAPNGGIAPNGKGGRGTPNGTYHRDAPGTGTTPNGKDGRA